MIAYSYLRISTPEQKSGDGERRQNDATTAYCAEQNLDLHDIPISDLGLSGYTAENLAKGALGAFLDKVGKGGIKTPCALVVENLDRISRQELEDAVFLMLSIVRAGVEIHTTMDRKIYRRGNIDFPSMLNSIMVLARGHDESKTKSTRIASSWSKKRDNALNRVLTKQCPGWLTVKEDRSGFAVIHERVVVLKEIFSLTIKGHSKAKIAALFNGRQEPVWGAKRRAGMRWHPSYIQKILEGRAVLGEIQLHRKVSKKRVPEGEPLAGYYPAIITEKIWQQAQASRAARLRHRAIYPNTDAPRNLLQGLVHLNGAKAHWVNKGRRKTSGGSRHTKRLAEGYWVYFVTKDPATGATVHRMRRELAENMVIGRLVEIDPADLTTPTPVDPNAIRISQLQGRIKELTARIERMAESIATGAASSIIGRKIVEDEKDLEKAQAELIEFERLKSQVAIVSERMPRDIKKIRDLALLKDDPKTREALTRHFAEIIARVDLATTPAELPGWCKKAAMLLAKLYSKEAEGGDAAAGWVAITLRDGNRIAGFATGDPSNPKIITVSPSSDVPEKTVHLYIGNGTVRAEQSPWPFSTISELPPDPLLES